MSQSGDMDPEEISRLINIGERMAEIRNIASESTILGGGGTGRTDDLPDHFPDDLPEEFARRPLGEFTIGELAEAEGASIEGIPEDIVDRPLSELTLDDVTRAVDEGGFGLGGAGQTFVICGGSGCAVYDN